MQLFRNNTVIELTPVELEAAWNEAEQKKALQLAEQVFPLVLKEYSSHVERFRREEGFLEAVLDPKSPYFVLQDIAEEYRSDREKGVEVQWGPIVIHALGSKFADWEWHRKAEENKVTVDGKTHYYYKATAPGAVRTTFLIDSVFFLPMRSLYMHLDSLLKIFLEECTSLDDWDIISKETFDAESQLEHTIVSEVKEGVVYD